MKNHRHRRLRDLLFLLLTLTFISLIPATSSAILVRLEPELAFNNTILVVQNDEDENGEDEDENEVETSEVEPPQPQIKRMPPAQPVPSPAPPAIAPVPPAPPVSAPPSPAPVTQAPPAEKKLPELKGEIPGQLAPPPAEVKPPAVQEEVPVKPIPPKPEKKPADVSFFFDDADVYEVIQTIFGEVLKVNYIVDPKIRGRVNFRTTTPIPKDEVLPVMEIILRLNGIAIVEEKGLYRIIAITDIPKEPAPIRFGRDPKAVELKGIAIVQVVQLQYISSTEIIKILTPLLSQGGFVLDVPPNFLIMADTDANVKRLLEVVEIFDSEKLKLARPQVFVYPVQNGKAKDIAAMLQQIFLGAKPATPAPTGQPTTTPRTTTPAPVTAPSPSLRSGESVGGEALVSEVTKIFADEITNTIIILATPEDFTTISEAIKKIDIVPRQVMIEAMVAAVQLTDELNFGVQWLIQNDIKISGLKPFGNDDTVNLSGPLQLLTPLKGSNFSFTALDEAGNIKLLLQSLAAEDKVKILAAPHVLVSDNREASIQVGQQIPIATSTISTPGIDTGTLTSSVQYKDIGIILKVKPQVNESGLVSLEISQEISSLGSTVKIADQEYQGINKTEAKTNLVSKDGQTIIIGGLIREDITRNRTGIPFLSKIPILGYLFGSTLDKSIRQELIILLTPRVMRTMQEAKDVTSDYVDRVTRGRRDITREELMQGLKREKQEREKNLPSDSSSP
jgi:type II secretory pathway component GspD/PulD (secretin)